jgi:hypothetical protein
MLKLKIEKNKLEILKDAKQLRNSTFFQKVYINPDQNE